MINNPIPVGWQCPRCETLYSPLVFSCEKCSPKPEPAPKAWLVNREYRDSSEYRGSSTEEDEAKVKLQR